MSLLTIGLIAVSICLCLAIFSIMGQALEQKRTEKRLRSAALQRRIAQLNELLTGFPAGYLSRELEAFLHHNIIMTYERLNQLNSNPQCREMAHKHREAAKMLLQSPETTNSRTPLNTPQQIKEVKTLLKDLSGLISHAVETGSLPRVQAHQFKLQLNKTMLTVNLESYQFVAQQAIGANKLQVAIHYYEQAKKLLLTNNATDSKQQIVRYDQLIKNLTDKLAQEASSLTAKNLAKAESQGSMENHQRTHTPHINDDSDPAKKKQLYD